MLIRKGNDLYFSSSGFGTISRLSLVDGSVSPVLSVPNPFGISFDALGNMYFIDHEGGRLLTYNFVDPPRVLATVTPSGGTNTGFGFNGRLLWADYRLATFAPLGEMVFDFVAQYNRLIPQGPEEVFSSFQVPIPRDRRATS